MSNRALENEIAGDPLGEGYASMTDDQLLVSLNAKTRTRNLTSIDGRTVRDRVDNAEYDALTDAKKQQFLTLTAVEDLDPFGMAANVIKGIFGAGSTTLSNLAGMRTESISRSQEIGWGPVVKMKDLRMHTLSRKSIV